MHILALAIVAADVESAPVPLTAAQRYGQSVALCNRMSEMEGQQCLADLLGPSETELAVAFNAALKRAAQQDRSKELKAAQAAWEKFMYAQCDFEHAQFRGGTAYQSLGITCFIRLNAARIDELSAGSHQ